MDRVPYVLVVASSKGGTGRTTTALALGWLWSEAGLEVAVINGDPGQPGHPDCAQPQARWNSTAPQFLPELPAPGQFPQCDLVVIDGPGLDDRAAQRALRLADAVLLTSRADPLAEQALESSLETVDRARRFNPRLDVVGAVINLYDTACPWQRCVLRQLQEQLGDLVRLAVPFQTEMTTWLASPCGPPPDGPACAAYARLSEHVAGPGTAALAGGAW